MRILKQYTTAADHLPQTHINPMLNTAKRIRTNLCCAVWLAIAIALTSCTNQYLYDAIQQNQRLECQERPLSEFDACMEAHSESYEDYQQKRQQTLADS